MHVLYFHQHFSTPAGATGNRSYWMARALVAGGHRVTMVCGSYGQGATSLSGPFLKGRRTGCIDGIDVIEFELHYSNADGFLQRAATFLRFAWRGVVIALRRDYDLVFATTTPLTAGIPGIAARWLRRKRFVFEVRDLWPELPRAMGAIRNPIVLWAMSVLEFVSYRSAHRLVALAPGIADGIARRGVPRDRIVEIPNGCDIELFAGAPAAWRPDGIGSGFLAVYAGTHGLANGLDAALDAAAELQRRGRDDIRILLVGDGMTKAALEVRAAREGLDNVIFHAPVGKAQLARLFASADLGLQLLADIPAFYDGTSPNKFFDYISAGLPVLINYPGWVAQLVHEHRCGFAVPPRDAAAFADALVQAADERAALVEKGAHATALARARFDRSKLAAEFVGWLEQAVLP